ncbi:hypothetical protein MsAg5_10110 [Methanosarcinaceae archaeon Ag5]|uniref:Stress-response A/B barrel domain-containing protein n=1 Tax=Methanolapillus africanus TaxID=3028297 RepID=A0AAE4MJK0_9EURY|nr:hypothetical protein [Methanosarcinaceae archaeon Ag5]
MLRHIVIWTLKDEALGNPAAKNALLIKEKLEGLFGKIPEILSIQVQSNCLDGAGNGDVVLICDFESAETLKAYQKNPLHVEVAEFVRSVNSGRSSIDFEF